VTTIAEDALAGSITGDLSLTLIEPHLYSVFPDKEIANAYDTRFGTIYDLVACNRLYNRLVWGYSVSLYDSLVSDALRSSTAGCVLDLGCGSLAFTAGTYVHYTDRPVVLVDQSLKMLRIARSRLMRLHGSVPDNMVFLQADARRLPFRQRSFDTLISLNLIHCIDDTRSFLEGLKSIKSNDGRMYFTTLVKGNRLADRYLKVLADSGQLFERNMDQHRSVFESLGIPIRYSMSGNMMFMYH
jgi:ubiquinone/menaquinone biosynthesis C-methylase UbiE